MIYRKGTKLEVTPYNFVAHQGGLGDFIAQLPAIKYVLENHPQIEIKLWCHEYAFSFAKELFKEYPMIVIDSLNNSDGIYDENLLARSPYVHKIQNLSMHLTDHAFLSLVGRSVEDKYKNYLELPSTDISEFNLPEKYMVITTGFTSKTRVWNKQSVQETCDYITSIGYTPVFLGKSFTPSYKDQAIIGNFDVDLSKGISLIDKTDLFQATSIMGKAACVIGVDNGLLHLACMTKVPVIYAFTSVEAQHRLPYRNGIKGWNCYPIELPELECFGCQSKMNFADGEFSFTQCFYDDYKCISMLTSDKFIEQIKQILL